MQDAPTNSALAQQATRAAASILNDYPDMRVLVKRENVLQCMALAWLDGWSRGGLDASEMVARYIAEVAQP